MRFLSLFLLLGIIILPPDVRAQGAFVDRGANGILIGGNMTPVDSWNSYAAEVGFSFNGTLDIGGAYSWLEMGADSAGAELIGRGLEPRLTLHLAKQGSKYPFSLSAHASRGFNSLDTTPGSDYTAEVKGRLWRVGGHVHTIIQLTDFAGIRPWGAISYLHRVREYTFDDGSAPYEMRRDDTEYLLGAQLIFMPTVRSVLFVGPQVRYLGGERSVGASAGLVFN